MDVLGLILLIIGPLLALGSFIFLYIKLKKLIGAIALETYNFKKEFLIYGLCGLGMGLGILIFGIGIPLYWKYSLQAYEWACLILGGFLLGFLFGAFFTTFRIHYYQTKMDKRIDKMLYIIVLASVPLMILSLWLFTEGFANHIPYPLVNGIGFENGFHLTTAKSGKANLAWYAICILSGAILVYFMCDHFMYQEFGKHGLVDSTFLIAFPSGIIGARIFYVLGDIQKFIGKEWWKPFAIWEGGLTILGGAVTGIVVGVAWFMHKNKDIPIGKAVNIIVPTILVAQAVGRWGNFFNAEVHGLAVDGAAWEWLPSIIYNQMRYSTTASGPLPDGQIYLPLFLIESVINIIGYYVLFFGIGKGLKRFVANGDLAFGYIAWYGLTRALLEPLRHPDFNMGEKGRWSWIWSIIYVAIGLFVIILNHVVRYILRKKKEQCNVTLQNAKKYQINSIIGVALTALISLAVLGVGLGLYFGTTMEGAATEISLVPHNIGLMMWIIGISLVPSIVIPSLYLYDSTKILNNQCVAQ